MRCGLARAGQEESRGMTSMSSSVVWRNWLRKNAKDVSVGAVAGFLMVSAVVFSTGKADADTRVPDARESAVAVMVDAMQNETRAFGDLPRANPSTRRWFTVPISAYTSEAAQTDSTPCIAARGFDLCAHNEEDVIAANFLPMGAQVRIPDLYGDRVFTVVDRMNARYDRRVDIWMREYADAKVFGVKYATIEVF